MEQKRRVQMIAAITQNFCCLTANPDYLGNSSGHSPLLLLEMRITYHMFATEVTRLFFLTTL